MVIMDYHFPTELIQDNIFSFVNPDELECLVVEYTIGHRIVTLQVYDPNLRTTKRLVFLGVSYFSGPLNWPGANFKFMSWKETIQFFSELHDTSKLREAEEYIQKEASKHFKLYMVTAVKPKMETTIVARNGFVDESSTKTIS